jgi:HSP20 family protein
MTSRDPSPWMWAQACELLERAERLHRQFFQLGTSRARHPAWEPPVDIMEYEHELAILVALPGVEPRYLTVGFDSGGLVVAGVRPLPAQLRAATVHRLEIPHGRFERRIELPPGQFEVLRQELSNGCLLVSLRKL